MLGLDAELCSGMEAVALGRLDDEPTRRRIQAFGRALEGRLQMDDARRPDGRQDPAQLAAEMRLSAPWELQFEFCRDARPVLLLQRAATQQFLYRHGRVDELHARLRRLGMGRDDVRAVQSQ